MHQTNHRELYNRLWQTNFNKQTYQAGDLELALQHIKNSLLLQKKHKILEIGCGPGHLVQALYKQGYKQIIGTDISDIAIKHGHKRYPHLQLLSMDATKLSFPKQHFDMCLSFDLFEHLSPLEQDVHLGEIYRVLKPGGSYVFQTPNILTNSIVETIKQKNLSWRIYHPGLHFSWRLKQKLHAANFSEIKFYKVPPLSQYKLRKMPDSVQYIFSLIPWTYLPTTMQFGFYVTATK